MLPLPLGVGSAPAPRGAPALPSLSSSVLVPPWLAGQHFAAALVCYGLGALGLVVFAPDLARGWFFVPRVIALVHFFTLGWIVLSIFGVLCQFLPVAVGRSLRFLPLAHVSFGAQSLGLALFVAALLATNRSLLLLGALLLTVAFVTFALNLAATLVAVRERSLTYWALAGAAVFLLVTPAYGFVLALGLHDGITDRFATVGHHAHIALLGVVFLVVIGVAHRLLPMFLLSHGVDERAAWLALGSTFAAATILAVPPGAWGGSSAGAIAVPVAGALGGAGVIAFVVQAASFFKHRQRRALDPGMRLAAAGVLGLIVALLLAPFALSHGLSAPRLLTTYFVVLLGSFTLFVAGHYYKIVPFLVWNHRYGPLLGKQRVPKVSELFSERVANVDAALLVSGLAGVAVATALGAELLARAAAIVFAAGAWLQVIVIARIAARKPA